MRAAELIFAEPSAEPVNDSVDHLAVIRPPAAAVVAHRQQRLQRRPLVVGQVPSAEHAQDNELPDRRDTPWSTTPAQQGNLSMKRVIGVAVGQGAAYGRPEGADWSTAIRGSMHGTGNPAWQPPLKHRVDGGRGHRGGSGGHSMPVGPVGSEPVRAYSALRPSRSAAATQRRVTVVHESSARVAPLPIRFAGQTSAVIS